MAEGVYLIGAARTDFKRNLRKEGKSLRDVIVEAGRAAIADAGLQPRDVRSGVVGQLRRGTLHAATPSRVFPHRN